MENKTFSIVIPTLNAEKYLLRCIHSVRKAQQDVEIVVVDGGSVDKTISIAKQEGVAVINSKRGRGYQLNAGATHTTGELLLFLHADTELSANTFRELQIQFANPSRKVGTCILRFDMDHWLLEMYSRMTKIDSLWTRFGDQCIVVRREFFNSLGGFPEWPLFEDVRFLQDARKKTPIYSFPIIVTTSAEKFVRNGIIRQQIKNGCLILQYLMGVSPNVLYQKYCP